MSHRSLAVGDTVPDFTLSDQEGKPASLRDLPLGLLDGRVTYVIDPGGVIRHIFNSQLRTQKHVEEALRLVRTLRGDGAGASGASDAHGDGSHR